MEKESCRLKMRQNTAVCDKECDKEFLKKKRDQIFTSNPLIFMARQGGLEPPTDCLEGNCSIRLSYWRAYEESLVIQGFPKRQVFCGSAFLGLFPSAIPVSDNFPLIL